MASSTDVSCCEYVTSTTIKRRSKFLGTRNIMMKAITWMFSRDLISEYTKPRTFSNVLLITFWALCATAMLELQITPEIRISDGSFIYVTRWVFRACLHQASASTPQQLCYDATDTVLIKNKELDKKNALQPHPGVTQMFSMRRVLLASHSCRSIDPDAWVVLFEPWSMVIVM